METQTQIKTEQTEDLIAQRIFDYYMQIIDIKRSRGVKSFVVDSIPSNSTRVASLVHLEDKYDSKSMWRKNLGIKDSDNWNTLPGSFRDCFNETEKNFYVIIENVLEKVSKLLSQNGIANYFDEPKEEIELDGFYPYDHKWLWIVL